MKKRKAGNSDLEITFLGFGAVSPKLVDGTIGAGEFRLSADELKEIEAKLSPEAAQAGA